MEFHRRRTVAAIVAAGLAAACSTPFPDDTAEVRLSGQSITFDLEACGLDRDTVFIFGRSDSGEVLQAVVGVEAADDGDGYAAVPEGSGLTYTDGATEWAAFGNVAWDLRGGDGRSPGDVTAVDVDGSRITIDATAANLDGDRVVDDQRVEVTLEARCDAATTA